MELFIKMLILLQLSTSNHMFGRAIWDKLPEPIFENFEISRLKQGKNCPNQTCDYWIITPNKQASGQF